jgi:magnesium chelatase subunit I
VTSHPLPASPPPTTLGQLRAAGHAQKTVKAELRDNLLARLAAGEDRFPGIVGFDETVLPQVGRCSRATTSSCSASEDRARPG